MKSNIAIDYRNPVVIRKMGIDALTKELGAVGMAYFIQQFDRGEGNYTEEREITLADATNENIINGIKAMRKQDSHA